MLNTGPPVGDLMTVRRSGGMRAEVPTGTVSTWLW
jgi:hypothetical protein